LSPYFRSGSAADSAKSLYLNVEPKHDRARGSAVDAISFFATPAGAYVVPEAGTPPIQRNSITSTSQIRANLQANNGLNQRASKNFASIPPLRQNITPFPGKRVATNEQTLSAPSHPLGPQRSNSTLTPRVAPMAAVIPVMDDGKLKNRVPSPEPKHYLKRQSSRDGEQGYESDYPVQ